MDYYYNPIVQLLLINHSSEKVKVVYNDTVTLQLPKIGPRPPFYIHPRYEQHYPVI